LTIVADVILVILIALLEDLVYASAVGILVPVLLIIGLSLLATSLVITLLGSPGLRAPSKPSTSNCFPG
jgi:hypothetical protein